MCNRLFHRACAGETSWVHTGLPEKAPCRFRPGKSRRRSRSPAQYTCGSEAFCFRPPRQVHRVHAARPRSFPSQKDHDLKERPPTATRLHPCRRAHRTTCLFPGECSGSGARRDGANSETGSPYPMFYPVPAQPLWRSEGSRVALSFPRRSREEWENAQKHQIRRFTE